MDALRKQCNFHGAFTTHKKLFAQLSHGYGSNSQKRERFLGMQKLTFKVTVYHKMKNVSILFIYFIRKVALNWSNVTIKTYL